jgi:hypothetical protein
MVREREKGIQIGKKEVKLSLFLDNILLNLKYPNGSVIKLFHFIKITAM